jgi:hypothetical protein
MVTDTAAGKPLTPIEQRLVDYVTSGKSLDLAAAEPVDEAAMRSWGSSRTVQASVLRDILRGRLAPDPDPHGLRLRGARIAGRLDLANLTTKVGLELVDCLLDEGLIARDAKLPGLVLSGSRLEHPDLPPLDADLLTAAMLVLNRAVITADHSPGAVRLLDAHLGRLECSGTTIRNSAGPALAADNLQVDQDAFLSDGFEAGGEGEDGAVRLRGAHLGELECRDAWIRNDSGPALLAEGLQVDQALSLLRFEVVGGGSGVTLDLSDVRVGGVLVFAPERLEHTTNPQARLALDGLTYAGLPQEISSQDWLRLLREATPSYAPQPYQQFAAPHRAAGNDGDGRRALIAQQQDQIDRGGMTRGDRALAHLSGLIIGYGYQPWRLPLFLATIALTAVFLTLTLGGHGGVAHTDRSPPAGSQCSTVELVGVGLDLGLPLIKTGIRDYCDTTASATGHVLTVAGWGLQLLAWAFATLVVASFTDIFVRKT